MSSKVVRIFPRGGLPAPRPAQTPAQRPSDRDLLSRVARGDTAAHRALFDRYYARVTAFVRRRVRDEGLCEEIVSDVFFEVWRGADAFRGESEVHSWIFGIAHFKAISARRFQGQLKRSSVVPTENEALQRFADDADVEDQVGSREEVRRLAHALERLPKGQADVLRLAFLEGRSYQEIADELGISEGNVKTRVNRARARLRTLMRRGDGGGT
ncbi:MAG: RNA polymerase sigma factor [Myxococcota bacterium]